MSPPHPAGIPGCILVDGGVLQIIRLVTSRSDQHDSPLLGVSRRRLKLLEHGTLLGFVAAVVEVWVGEQTHVHNVQVLVPGIAKSRRHVVDEAETPGRAPLERNEGRVRCDPSDSDSVERSRDDRCHMRFRDRTGPESRPCQCNRSPPLPGRGRRISRMKEHERPRSTFAEAWGGGGKEGGGGDVSGCDGVGFRSGSSARAGSAAISGRTAQALCSSHARAFATAAAAVFAMRSSRRRNRSVAADVLLPPVGPWASSAVGRCGRSSCG